MVGGRKVDDGCSGRELRCVLGTALWETAALLDGREWDCWVDEGWKTVPLSCQG